MPTSEFLFRLLAPSRTEEFKMRATLLLFAGVVSVSHALRMSIESGIRSGDQCRSRRSILSTAAAATAGMLSVAPVIAAPAPPPSKRTAKTRTPPPDYIERLVPLPGAPEPMIVSLPSRERVVFRSRKPSGDPAPHHSTIPVTRMTARHTRSFFSVAPAFGFSCAEPTRPHTRTQVRQSFGALRGKREREKADGGEESSGDRTGVQLWPGGRDVAASILVDSDAAGARAAAAAAKPPRAADAPLDVRGLRVIELGTGAHPRPDGGRRHRHSAGYGGGAGGRTGA